MLTFSLLLLIGSTTYVGVDFGSQFIKVARSGQDGRFQIFADPSTHSITFPSAVAFKFNTSHSPPFAERDFEDLDVRCGGKALPVLRGNASLGIEFLPRVLGRARDPEFFTTNLANETELTAFLLRAAIARVGRHDKIGIAIPFYYTRPQTRAIYHTAHLFQDTYSGMVDDVTAIAAYYSAINLAKFIKQPRHVFFVDVGSSSVEAYSLLFNYTNPDNTKESVTANQTSGSWSEKVGGYLFSQAVARNRGISIRKAQKKLLRSVGEGDEETVADLIQILEQTVQQAFSEATIAAPIDEVQLFGGSSAFKFVSDTIKRITNQTFLRDCHSNGAIALGTVAAITNGDASPYVPVTVWRRPSYSYNVTCDAQSAIYCVKGRRCDYFVNFPNQTSFCSDVSVVADKSELPDGVSAEMDHYSVQDPITIEDPNGNLTGQFLASVPDAVLKATRWCLNETCNFSRLSVKVDNFEALENSFAFLRMQSGQGRNRELREEIVRGLERLSGYLEKIETRKVEPVYPVTDAIRAQIAEVAAAAANDGLEALGATRLKELRELVVSAAKSLNVKLG
jgi:hypothetical protein